MADKLRVGILGFGTVGTGVVKGLTKNAELIAFRTGMTITITRIAVSNINRKREIEVNPAIITTDASQVTDADDIDLVVELIGGTDLAKDYVLAALNNGKSVVTANKSLIAKHGEELFQAAKKSDADLYYEASVAGGIPIIKGLREGFAGNHIECIYGILNGTCNYILTRMENEGVDFEPVLKEAQALGYAEADPELDVEGWDAAHKTCILGSLAYGAWYDMDEVHVEGISTLDQQDVKNAANLGYKIKLLGIIKHDSDQVQMRVHPTLLPQDKMLAKVDGVNNSVCVTGDFVGDAMFYGQGAGMEATASSVISDIVDVALNWKHKVNNRLPAFVEHTHYQKNLLPMSEIVCRYYIRLALADKPGTLGIVTSIFGKYDISLETVLQTASDSTNSVPVIIITHQAKEANIRAALKEIEESPVSDAKPIMIRIEDM
ncbi:MAG: homoserine dehydrogenase [Lentisphaeria bacterium]|nr:homoserine dehydrogenase [Lentisphaeria bacterium]